MLPVNDLKFQPLFLGLQNEEEVIDALDTNVQKKIVTKSKKESEKDRRRKHTSLELIVLFSLFASSTLLASSRKQELGGESQFQRWANR